LLFFTPYKIIAGNYHREAEGLKDLDVIFRSAKAAEARIALRKRKTDALFYCAPDIPEESWLLEKKRPGWLLPVAEDTTHLFKIRK
jgi:hypothetical protein